MVKSTLNASNRSELKASELRKMRKEHFTPGIVYGHHMESMPVKIKTFDLENYLHHHGIGTNLNLVIDKKPYNVLIKDIQVDRLKDKIVHIDFQVLVAGEKVNTSVPIRIIGKDVLEHKKIIMQEVIHDINLSTLPEHLIEFIEVDVTELEAGDMIKVEDLSVFNDDKYDMSYEPEDVVITLLHAQEIEVESEEDEEVVVVAGDIDAPVPSNEDNETE